MPESDPIQARLIELESKLAWAEDLLDTLNMTVFRQQREIERLQKQVLALDGQIRSLVALGQPASVRDEIPPHY